MHSFVFDRNILVEIRLDQTSPKDGWILYFELCIPQFESKESLT